MTAQLERTEYTGRKQEGDERERPALQRPGLPSHEHATAQRYHGRERQSTLLDEREHGGIQAAEANRSALRRPAVEQRRGALATLSQWNTGQASCAAVYLAHRILPPALCCVS